jgi:pimeloyl-ACP methyl ester carboxylesterase
MKPILHSKIIGNGDPLFILHGLFGMSDNWLTLGRKFSEHFEVHLIDLRNHGRSFHDDVMGYEVMVQDIVKYLEHYNLNTINILGHSMGGKVAMFFAVLHPEKVEKLIVADIAPKNYPNRHQFIFNALDKVDFDLIKTREAIRKILNQSIPNQGIVQFLLKNVYHKTVAELDWRFNKKVLQKNYKSLNEPLPSFYTFDKETLFLKGGNSDYILASDERFITAHFPNAQIETISNAGHWLHAENPDEFYEKCRLFLKAL